MRAPEFYKLVKRFCYVVAARMNKIFPMSSGLTYNIAECSQFTTGTVSMGMFKKITEFPLK